MQAWTRPEILAHPNIPKPLHGMNPRTLLGREWWDKHRQEAYAKYDYHCWACGVAKRDAKYHQWLEGHEYYDFNYDTGELKLKEIVALCHSCHNFIHSGRLWIMFQKGEIPREKIEDILAYGFAVLKPTGIKPFFGTILISELLAGTDEAIEMRNAYRQGSGYDNGDDLEWNEWHLNINGVKYYSQFKNEVEWYMHYNS